MSISLSPQFFENFKGKKNKKLGQLLEDTISRTGF